MKLKRFEDFAYFGKSLQVTAVTSEVPKLEQNRFDLIPASKYNSYSIKFMPEDTGTASAKKEGTF